MLHIVLFLLKIIGIILASILGLLLFLILVVLLIPIRYRIDADNKEEIRADAKISWLLRIIYIRIIYSDNKMIIKLRLFGKIFYDSGKPKEKRKSKKTGNLKEIRKPPIKKSGTKTEKNIKKQNGLKPAEITETQRELKSIGEVQIQKEITRTDNKTIIEADKTRTDMKAAEISDSQGQIKVEHKNGFSEDFDVLGDDLLNEKQKSLFGGIKRFFHKIKEIFSKIKNWFHDIKNKILNLKETLLSISGKWIKIKAFLKEDENKNALSKSFTTIKRIVKHIRPTKLKLELEFGTGDPCSTGQALGVLAMFYGYYGKSMQVIPNFEEEILEGSLFCIGRIRLITLLIICIQLILNKNFRNLLKNFKTLKEDL
ncbi:MAG: DUF2953 domain-containing protein [Anaerocolumna sp.]